MLIRIAGPAGPAAIAGCFLWGCSSLPAEMPPAASVLPAPADDARLAAEDIPAPVRQVAVLSRPQPAKGRETYSVVVNNVRADELLFSLARDAGVNVDIHPGVTGGVTLTAINQSLPQLLNRIVRQVDMRWEIDGRTLVVMPDSPFLRVYRIDYVNMSRDTGGNTTVTTQIASAAPGGSSGGGVSIAGGGNNSQTRIENTAKNHFWDTLEKNLKDLLRETDKILPEGSSETVVEHLDQQSTTGTGAQAQKGKGRSGNGSGNSAATLAASPNPATFQQEGTTLLRRTTFREAASVIVNPESGTLSVRATSRQHEKIQEFLDQVMASANRQVMIEATIAEVQLSSNYQQGIDWSILPLGDSGFRLIQRATGNLASPSSSLFEIGNKNRLQGIGMVESSIRLLENFGTVRVLSSPTLSVINNQTAVLKVVDNYVYFTIKAETVSPTNAAPVTTFTTNLSSVPVGFVMNVTPQIGESGQVLLNIRPSISRVVDTVNDPNPDLARANVTSRIPVIRVREMESMIRVASGNIVVMGGLMEDTVSDADAAVPGLSRAPVIGNFFMQRDDRRLKTELVVFLRPVVMGHDGMTEDFKRHRGHLSGLDGFSDASAAPRLARRSEPDDGIAVP